MPRCGTKCNVTVIMTEIKFDFLYHHNVIIFLDMIYNMMETELNVP